MTDNDFRIRRMRPEEVQLAIDWAAAESWNPGLHDAVCFYQADNDGFFIGEYQGQTVAVGSAVTYDSRFAFCGLYIVKPEYRGRGFGLQLTKARLEHVGERNAGIDGVVENISIYERIGYRLAYYQHRFCCDALATGSTIPQIQKLADLPFGHVAAYDRDCFPAARTAFLKAWIRQPDSLALGFAENDELKGYAVRRRCLQGHKIGPLFADDRDIAEQLFDALQQDIDGETLYLDVPEINPAAMELAQARQMEEVFVTGRMYLKGSPENIMAEKQFGITSFELG